MSDALLATLSPAAGCHGDGAFHFPIRVYYEDTDAGGIVYHAGYLKFAERARTEFMRSLGWAHDRLVSELGVIWVVRRLLIDYRRPARLDDSLRVATFCDSLQGASIDIRQQIWRGDTELATLQLQIALLTPEGRPARLPGVLASALTPFLAQRTSQKPWTKLPSTP
jgi:acyl-CoA thioester hydrolase